MSILKRIFGSSKAGSSDNPQKIARPPRVRVTELHRVLFRRSLAGSRKEIHLGNISTKGMGLLRSQAGELALGEPVQGELYLNELSFPIEGEVRHKSDEIIGCQFNGSFDPVSKAIEDYFRVEILGLTLNRVDEAYLKQDPAGQVAWFTDGRQNEIYYVNDANGIVFFHLSFLGNYIEGGRGRKLKAGHIVEDSSFSRGKQKGAALLELQEEISSEILSLGRLLISNVDQMPKEHRNSLQALLNR